MEVFVTGATGYIGSALAHALTDAGHAVVALARSDESARRLTDAGIEPLRGDLRDIGSLRRGAQHADGAVHAASPGDETSAEADDIVIATLLDEFKGSGRPFVYTSGIAVHGSGGDSIIDENSPYNPSPLVAFRVNCEKKVKASAFRGVRSVVVSPAFVYGDAGGVPGLWFDSARKYGIVYYVGDGENRWPTVHVSDLADLYVRALLSAPPGSHYIGAEGAAVRVHDAAEAASVGAGIPGEVESWPYETARQTLGPLADLLVLDQQASGEKAKRELGWQPAGPNILDDLRAGSYTRLRANRESEGDKRKAKSQEG